MVFDRLLAFRLQNPPDSPKSFGFTIRNNRREFFSQIIDSIGLLSFICLFPIVVEPGNGIMFERFFRREKVTGFVAIGTSHHVIGLN